MSTAPTLAEAAAIPKAVDRAALHYALIVGIGRYPGITNLRGPDNDAEDIRRWLVDPAGGGVPEKNIEVVHARGASFAGADDAVPTRTVVNNALERLLDDVNARVRSRPLDWRNTRLYVYLSGHGLANNTREAALLMANARLGRAGESLPSRVYMDFFEDTQTFRELVFFADCCRTPSINAELAGPPWNRVPGQRGKVSSVLGFATAFGDLAFEPTNEQEPDPDATRGYFTRALLEGLRGGAADGGRVDSNSLAKYVRDRVIELTKDRRPPQVAPMFANLAEPVFFCDVPEARWPATITFPDGFLQPVELYDGSARPVAAWNSKDGAWSISLTKGLYEVRPAGAADGTIFQRDGLFRVLGEARDVRL